MRVQNQASTPYTGLFCPTQLPTVVYSEKGYGLGVDDILSGARKTLAENLQYVMDHHLDPELKTDVGVAKRCGGGMSYKTVERMRLGTGESPPNFANVVRVASVFSLQAWQLLMPRRVNLGPTMVSGSEERRAETQGTSASSARRKTRRN